MTPDRRPLLAANWKMNLATEAAQGYCRTLRQQPSSSAQVLVFPSFPFLPLVVAGLDDWAQVGGQDVHPEPAGAHTGDVSAEQLRDVGCRWVLCGHSERRRDHGEADELVAAKVRAAERAGLLPLLCLGETLEEREGGSTERVLDRQLRSALGAASGPLELAYEPVWAIGTGRSATPELAQEAHEFLRRRLARERSGTAATSTRILYGGSVNPENCVPLFSQPDVDGFLIGGASLDPDRFLDIIRRCGA